ncbi:hypothetical protein NJBCHELONAE_02100 [Mycobacteroides chelonae]|nr:hypothetical protein NJBCHELONAE_02100 [Mycobacteroides chelonae]
MCSVAFTELEVPPHPDEPYIDYHLASHEVDNGDPFDLRYKTWKGASVLARHFLCASCRSAHGDLSCVYCWYYPVGLPPARLAVLDDCHRCDFDLNREEVKGSIRREILKAKDSAAFRARVKHA